MTEISVLPGWGRRPFATGRAPYFDHNGQAQDPFARIFLEVRPGFLPLPVLAMVDTAAPWCIFEPRIGAFVRENFHWVSKGVPLSTRLGTFRGDLYRVPLFFEAFDGEPLDVEATVFVSPDWPGDNFLGYEGLLQRIRFAVDPEVNLFYFGRI